MCCVWTNWQPAKRRGNEFLRCGAQTPTLHLRGEGQETLSSFLASLSAKADSGRIAPQRRISIPRFPCFILWTTLFLLTAAVSAQAAPPAPVTTPAQMTVRLKAEAAHSPLVHVVSLGKSAVGKRDLWLVRLADPAADTAKTTRLLVLCRQHGDEPASTEAMLHLIQGIASGGDPALRLELAHVTLYVIPMVNPDGAGAGTRVNGVGADLNRDWGFFTQPETRAVASAAKLIHPALIVDAHNWDGNDEYNADCIEIPREMETGPGRAAHQMQQQALRDLAACGYAVHPTAWGSDSNPHLAHRWFVHQNIPSLLVETHSGSPVNRADFERREGMYTALVHSLARHYAAPWMGKSPETEEAALFPIPPTPKAVRRVAALPKHPFPWLWTAGLYGLALWGLALRRPANSLLARSGKVPRQTVRYSYPKKRLGAELSARQKSHSASSPAAAPRPERRQVRRSSSPRLLSRQRLSREEPAGGIAPLS